MAPRWRDYDEARDLDAVARTWRECGWSDGSDRHVDGIRAMFSGAGTSVLVAPVEPDGDAECAVHRTSGTVRFDCTDLPVCGITGVTTSHVGRKQGLAAELMVEAVARGAEEGAVASMLGAFELGFYDRFGFGTGASDAGFGFDPATLTVPFPTAPTVRLGEADLDEVHQLVVRRHRGHGGLALDSAGAVHAEHSWLDTPVGLGLRDPGDGRLVGAMLIDAGSEEEGPYEVKLCAYERPEVLLELLGVVRSLGDQVRWVRFSQEPADVSLQDLVVNPVRQITAASLHGGRQRTATARPWWQVRILDVPASVAALRVLGEPIAFDLVLDDPIAREADRFGGRWSGIGGAWQVELGEVSTARAGAAGDGRPVVTASVPAWSRWWIGARPLASLVLTDGIGAPADLVERIDRQVRLPQARPGIEF